MNLGALNSLIGSYAGSTSGASGANATGAVPSRAQRRQDFEALDTALLSGDIGQAQSAFDQLNKDVQAAQGTGGKSAFAQLGQGDTTLGKDFKALSDALSGGDITGAQKAFATLRKDMQAARQSQGGGHVHGGGHRHRGNDNDGDDGVQSSGSSSPSTIVNISIDLRGLTDLLNAAGASGSGGTATAGTDIPAGSSAATSAGGSGTGASASPPVAATQPAPTAGSPGSTASTGASGSPTPSSDPTAGASATGANPSATTGSGSTPATGQSQGTQPSGPAFELDLNILSYTNNNGNISLTSLSASFFYTPGQTLSIQA